MIDISGIPNIPPVLIYFAGAALLPLLGKGKVRKIYLIILAALGLIGVAVLRSPASGEWEFSVSGFELIFLYVDPLSRIMGYIFAIIGAAAILYSIGVVKENGEFVCGLLYLGSAMGAVFAGDLFTLYIFWEIMAFSSLGLIWYSRTERATNAGMRYILFHLFGGCALLAGIIINYMSTGSITIVPGIGHRILLCGIGHRVLPSAYRNRSEHGIYTTAYMAAGFISEGNDSRCGIHVCIHDKDGSICTCENFPRCRTFAIR